MIENRVFCSLLLVSAVSAWPLAAQTSHPAATARRTAATSTHGGCVTLASLSPKIPALPASSPCAKTLYTVTRTPTMKLDYASPLVSEGVREELGGAPETFSLNFVDTKAGTGPLVEPHKCLSVQYTGYLVDGTKFDSSRDRGNQPIEFLYGGHQVIPGWDTGFEGMHMGGERRLFIPWELAYGENGRGPIPPKAELVFDVEAVSQSEPHAGSPPAAQCMRAPTPPPHRPEVPPAGAAPQGATPPPAGAKPQGATPPPASTTPPAGSSTPPATTPQPQH